MRVALTIAGSDSGGGAGIQGDLKTFARFGVFGTSVVTAVTAQNTRGIAAWEPVSPALVRGQLDAVLEDLSPHVVKTGMLGTAEIVRAVVAGIRERPVHPLVVDPVMLSTSGHRLLDETAEVLVREALIPLATLVTPNLDEAAVLVGTEIRDEGEMRRAARYIVRELGTSAALVTGGHGSTDEIVDLLLCRNGEWRAFRHARLHSRNTHGTGCALSAAIAAQLALGQPLMESVEVALEYVHRAIATAPELGSGYGPLNHGA